MRSSNGFVSVEGAFMLVEEEVVSVAAEGSVGGDSSDFGSVEEAKNKPYSQSKVEQRVHL